HLALSLERLSAITKTEPQRIGLSATQRPLSETARFLGGTNREVTIIDAGRVKPMEITVEVPVEDMADLERGAEAYSGPAAAIGADQEGPRRSIWPAIHPRILELVRQHRSTIIFPKYRGDLLETAVVVDRMLRGEIETTRVPRNPLDVLAQQIVAMTAMEAWSVAALAELVHRAYPFSDLGPRALESTLDMLSGRYPSDEFAELRPRIVWDRLEGTIRGRAGAQRLAVISGGTIPDRGL